MVREIVGEHGPLGKPTMLARRIDSICDLV